MLLKEIPVGDLFCFKGELVPKMKTKDGLVDLHFRTEHEAHDDDEVTELSIEMLCVIMHRQEILDWVNSARAFFIPDETQES